MKVSRLKISPWQISALILILFLAALLVYFNQSKEVRFPNIVSENPPDCVSEERQVTVRGDSLSGLIKDGKHLKILVGYYQCHPVEREDIVAYNYAGNQAPLLKIAKAVEGDKFALVKARAGDCWNLLINGRIAETSAKAAYCFDGRGYRMLSLYEKDYGGSIPKDALLILGNQTSGSLDSSRFGLMSVRDLLGKAVF